MLNGMGIHTGIDLEEVCILNRGARYWRQRHVADTDTNWLRWFVWLCS
jgi:hypothetical protein